MFGVLRCWGSFWFGIRVVAHPHVLYCSVLVHFDVARLVCHSLCLESFSVKYIRFCVYLS